MAEMFTTAKAEKFNQLFQYLEDGAILVPQRRSAGWTSTKALGRQILRFDPFLSQRPTSTGKFRLKSGCRVFLLLLSGDRHERLIGTT